MAARKSTRHASPGSKMAPQTVNEYILQAPSHARARLRQIRAAIRSVMPRDAVEIISYRIPAFGRKEVLVWFAAFSDHCSLFPKASVIAKFKDELKGFAVSKGTIQFPHNKPLPIPLIKRIVKARVAAASRA
jgi:uncharacterized protein YdhG (YjbR/CyaY superfamily)